MSDIVFRDGLQSSLSEIASALGSVPGVEAAAARQHKSRIVGIVTVNDDCSLSPHDIITEVRASYPENLWPDQVLLMYQHTFGAAQRRVA